MENDNFRICCYSIHIDEQKKNVGTRNVQYKFMRVCVAHGNNLNTWSFAYFTFLFHLLTESATFVIFRALSFDLIKYTLIPFYPKEQRGNLR